MGKIYIGTSGWSYKHWKNTFYPPERKPADYLQYYTDHFVCVELNSSFYHIPSEDTVKNWFRRSPDNFKFAIKVSRNITHTKKLKDIEGNLGYFFHNISFLKEKTGPILFQLPASLEYNKELISPLLIYLNNYKNRFHFAIEVRHKSWHNQYFYTLLRENNISLVISHSNEFPYVEELTSNIIYIRFHGQDKLYESNYDLKTLKKYAGKILEWANKSKEVWVFFNNDFEGYAVRDAKLLRSLITDINHL